MTEVIDKLAWLHLVEGRILCARSRGKAAYYIPGGKRERGESDEAALCREIREELRVTLLPETLQLVGRFEAQADGKAAGGVVRMTCYTADFAGEIAPDREIGEVAWLRYADRAQGSPVVRDIFDWLHQRGLLR